MNLFGLFRKEKKQSAVGSLISLNHLGQPVWSGRDYQSFAVEGYERNVVAYRCIAMVAQSIASVDWQVFRDKTKIDNHPMLDLLNRPNPMQSGCEFLEALVSFHMIAGNAYVEGAYPNADVKPSKKPPVFLYVLRPDRIKVIAGNGGMPSGYKYEVGGQSKTYPVAVSGLSNICHIRSFNPVNDWYGMADTEAAAYSIDQHNASSAWNQALLQNSAVPSSALFAKGNLTDEQFNRLKEMIEDRYSSPKNAGRPLLLEGEMDWKQMSITPKDMDWLEGKREAARDIALAYGVPPMLLGIPGDNTYNNQREARLALWEQTILPLLDKVTDALNYWLSPRYGDDVRLAYDMENISALRLRREQQRESLEKTTFLTINEKRAAMGHEPIDGGNQLYIESSRIPLGYDTENLIRDSQKMLERNAKAIGYTDEEIKCLSRPQKT